MDVKKNLISLNINKNNDYLKNKTDTLTPLFGAFNSPDVHYVLLYGS